MGRRPNVLTPASICLVNLDSSCSLWSTLLEYLFVSSSLPVFEFLLRHFSGLFRSTLLGDPSITSFSSRAAVLSAFYFPVPGKMESAYFEITKCSLSGAARASWPYHILVG